MRLGSNRICTPIREEEAKLVAISAPSIAISGARIRSRKAKGKWQALPRGFCPRRAR
jgi:hypothetical protein